MVFKHAYRSNRSGSASPLVQRSSGGRHAVVERTRSIMAWNEWCRQKVHSLAWHPSKKVEERIALAWSNLRLDLARLPTFTCTARRGWKD